MFTTAIIVTQTSGDEIRHLRTDCLVPQHGGACSSSHLVLDPAAF